MADNIAENGSLKGLKTGTLSKAGIYIHEIAPLDEPPLGAFPRLAAICQGEKRDLCVKHSEKTIRYYADRPREVRGVRLPCRAWTFSPVSCEFHLAVVRHPHQNVQKQAGQNMDISLIKMH